MSDALTEHTAQAGAAMQRSDFAAAEREYRAALALAPQMAEIRSNLGLALTFREKFAEAEKEFRASLKANPKLFVPNYFLGKRLFQTNRYKEAKPLLLAALVEKPEDRDVRRWLAVTYLGLQEHSKGIAEYRKLLKTNPRDAEAVYAIGKTYTTLMEDALGKISTATNNLYRNLLLIEAVEIGPGWRSLAKSELPRLIRENPSFNGLHFELGNLELEEGNWAAAEKLFEKELALDPLDYRARFGLAQVLLAQKELAGFSEQLKRAIQIRPEFFCPLPKLHVKLDSSALQALASQAGSRWAARFLTASAKDTGSFCQELEIFRKKLATDPKLASKPTEELFREKRFEAVINRFQSPLRKGLPVNLSPLLLARAYFETGDYEAASKTLETAARKEKFGDPDFYLLGRSYQKLAVQALEQMAQRAPESYLAYQLTGETLLAKRNPREALQAFNSALERQPQDAEIIYLVGRSHYLLGEFSQAFQLLEQAIQRNPYNAEAHYLIGEGLVYMKEGGKAIPYLRRTLELNPSMLRARAELGKAYFQASQFEWAAKELKQVTAMDSSGDLHYLLYRAYSHLNQKEEAAKALVVSAKLREEKMGRERRAVESRN